MSRMVSVALAALAVTCIGLSIAAGASARPPLHGDLDPRLLPNGELAAPLRAAAAPARHAVRESGWCERVAAGPAGARDVRVDLSAAAATTREFSVASPFGVADRALTAALTGPVKPNTVGAMLAAYAAALGDVCLARASPDALGRAKVRRLGPVALVTPGSGQHVLPRGTRVVVIDLRDLPAVDGLAAALERAAAPALKTPVERPARRVRTHDGPVDELFLADNIYSTSVTLDEQPAIAGTGSRDMPIVLLTSKRMAPDAAAFAGTLRFTRRAWIVGADVLAEVAEADWRGVADRGLAIRTQYFEQLTQGAGSQVLPAEIVHQEDPNDPTTTSYRRNLHAGPDTRVIDVTIDAPDDSDIDLYLLQDVDDDGSFSFPDEVVALSASPTADEHLRLSAQAGEYQIWVHGFFVPGGTAAFELAIKLQDGHPWPDVIPADLSPTGIAGAVHRLDHGAPGPVSGPAQRSVPEVVNPFGDRKPVVTAKPELRAALVTAHGMTRLFFPYFATVGDRIDARLIETLESVERGRGSDRRSAEDVLQRFGEALHDGHQFVFDLAPRTYGFLPVFLEEVGGRPVVRRSAIPELRAGDTILSMNGRRIEDIYAQQYRLTSTATHGYQFDVASRYVSRLYGTTTVKVADPGGAARTVTIEPQPFALYNAARAPSVSARPNGPLSDLGAPQLHYLNLNSFTSPTAADVNAAIADALARDSAGIVVDMRGYPGGDHFATAAQLINDVFLSPQFIVPFRAGPDHFEETFSQFPIGPFAQPVWNGRPIVLLTGPHAVSAAENFMQMLVGSGRVTAIVGVSSSAGTNGNITGISLPGGWLFTYTGMRVLNPDGSRFHGIGIVPTVRTTLTAADLRDGVDRDLLAAIDVLDGP
jgi:C-terminal processing protease CtpA/Prc